MYPEGWLIDPNGNFLVHFSKDDASHNKKPTGYIDKWNSCKGSPQTIKNQIKASATQAISEWIKLTEKGWRCIEVEFDNRKAA